MRCYKIRDSKGEEPFGGTIPRDSAVLVGAKTSSNTTIDELNVGEAGTFILPFFNAEFRVGCLVDTAKVVYDVDETCQNPDGTWYARRITEGKPGYVIIGHSVGATLEEAKAWCVENNGKLGISEQWKDAIIASSMAAQNRVQMDSEPGENECRLRISLEFDTYLTDEDRDKIVEEVEEVMQSYMDEHEAGMTYRVDLE
jgi:hypothetical protein